MSWLMRLPIRTVLAAELSRWLLSQLLRYLQCCYHFLPALVSVVLAGLAQQLLQDLIQAAHVTILMALLDRIHPKLLE